MPRRLSQNFLYDTAVLKRIIQVAGIEPGDTVVEIGAGPGSLTRLLTERAARVVAIELDGKLYEKLKERLGHLDNLELIRGDALRYDYGGLGPFKVVANIPYHITTPIIFKLLEYREGLVSMTLTVQREVAERVAASPGGRDYGVLSLTVQYYGRPKLKFLIPRKLFRPVPRVDSACLHIEVLRGPKVEVVDDELLFRVIRTAFTKRRKTLHNALKKLVSDVDDVLKDSGIDPGLRPEKLSIEDYARVADELSRRGLSAGLQGRAGGGKP
jgi:16S rRNA (adenine1518-N6/adenine1519-N6)-dimethyltransferase